MNSMPIIQIIVVLLVCSLAWWVYQTYVAPHVTEPFRTIIVVLLAVLVIVWLLSLVGLIGGGPVLFPVR